MRYFSSHLFSRKVRQFLGCVSI